MTSLIVVFFVLLMIYGIGALFFVFGLLLRQKPGNMEQPLVSIIVAARNEADSIAACIDCLVAQSYPADNYEIIIVNDNSTDETAAIVSTYCEKYPHLKLISLTSVPERWSPKKYALTRAIEQSHGEIIFTTDADCLVGENWVRTMVSYFTAEAGMVIGFSQLGTRGNGQPAFQQLQAFDFVNLMGAAAGAANLGLPLSATGQNLAYRRAAFDAVGGFTQVAHRISGDDVLLLQLIRNHTPWKIRFANDPAAYAISEPETTFRGFFNQRLRWASNGPYQVLLNIPFFLYLLAAFGSNLGLLFALFGWLAGGVSGIHFGVFLFIKCTLEFLVSFQAARRFLRMDLLGYFPLWFCLQPFYVLLMGTLSLIGRFSWKGRKHDIPGQ